MKRNKSLGIAENPNDLVRTPSFKDELKGVKKVKCVKIKPNEKRDRLEKEANKPTAKRFRYGVEMSKFCAYLITKHGDDYKVRSFASSILDLLDKLREFSSKLCSSFTNQAMERDPKNHYQKSAGYLKRVIACFKRFEVNRKAFELASKECEDECKNKANDRSTASS